MSPPSAIRQQWRIASRLSAWALLGALAGAARGDAPIDFNRDVRPILSDKCFKCHGPDEGAREADLRLDVRQDALADRGGYRAIDLDNPAASELLARVRSTDDALRMPPPESGVSISDDEGATLEAWIRSGATYGQHWSFRPIEKPMPPVRESAWSRTAIDQFVLEKLAPHGLKPSPEAPRETLIRRVHLDLLGLPPTIDEVEQFLRDDSPDAYEAMVDRALASPHYGERWGRHWLDQARYADTNGYSVDSPRPIWPYRDWVIRALNADMPFDRFTIVQLAGDLLPEASQEDRVATGFHRNTLINEEGGTDHEQFRVEAVVDRVSTTGAVWLGLTLGCAQCHSHKFDPISHQEFYQFFAFFNGTEDVNRVAPTLRLITAEQQTQLADLDRRIAAAKEAVKAAEKESSASPAAGGEAAAPAKPTPLEEERLRLAASLPETMVLRELATPRESHILMRGDFLRKGERVQPDTPAALPPLEPVNAGAGPTRLDLARWIVDRRNPLTARVTVNRVWARYFGRGIVEPENDFGMQGSAPSHPELLDWLAAEFMDNDWSLKKLHRLILTSAVYRQQSQRWPELEAVDPLNTLLARQTRLRVDAETMRDLGLSVSGLLNPALGGPSVYPPQPAGVYSFTQRGNANWPTSTGPDRYRRGLYTFFMRSAPYPLFTTFDAPRLSSVCTLRRRSNTPLQSLALANDETTLEFARALGRRIMAHAADLNERLRFAFSLCLAREPEPTELRRLAEYVRMQRADFAASADEAAAFAGRSPGIPAAETAAWTALARVMLNLDEFVTRE
jgi:hypothetical protein